MTNRSLSSERVALVTGGTRGIGRAIADRLARENHRVVVAARDVAALADVDPSLAFASDLARPGAGRALARRVLDEHGRLDVVVHGAGAQRIGPIESIRDEDWQHLVALHMTAAFELAREAIPAMRTRGFGRIVMVSSVHGLIGSAHKVPYTATKHGLVGIARSVAQELADDPITCNAVCPGFVRTALVEAQIEAHAERTGLGREAAAREMVAARQPGGKFVEAGEVAGLVAMLVSDAAESINGAALPIDRGWTAR